MILRGEVYWIDPRGAVGAEIRKVRPWVIVSNDDHNERLGTVIAAPISSGEVKGWLDEVEIPRGAFGDGRACRIKTHQIRCVDKSRIGGRLGALPPGPMFALDASLRVHLGLEPEAD